MLRNRLALLLSLAASALVSLSPARADDDAPLASRLADRLKEPNMGLKVENKPRAAEHNKEAKPKVAKGKTDPKMPALPPASQWAYAGDASPAHWAELAPDNKLCGIGTRQSPIDIRDTIKVDLEKIQFDYRPGSFSVVDNGRAIEVDPVQGNSLTVMGRRFELTQFHFHRPSEERINGRSYEMVMHLVHKDAEGNLAVLAILIERGPDNKPQPAVQAVLNNLPLERSQSVMASVPLDPMQLLPQDRSYFTYMGSLTTPPCKENVLWMVMRTPVQLTANQIAIFARLYPMNARPLQATSGRLIKESN
ncbi:MAG TPA: carbonic anhydrase family protein [Burkholderiaceae bacterium]|jgi:carbonic anhydrase